MRCLLILCCGILVATAVNLPGVPVDFNLDDKVLSAIADDVAGRLEEEYMTFLKTGVETPAFKKLTSQLAKAHTKRIYLPRICLIWKRVIRLWYALCADPL